MSTPPRRPESVLVVVYAGSGDVLLLRRAGGDALWQSVTGSLEWEESPMQAAVRELHEETGISVAESDLVETGNSRQFSIWPRWRHRYAEGQRFNTEYEFHLRVLTTQPITIDQSEHDQWCWLPIDQAIDQVFSWTNREALEGLKQLNKW